MSNRKNIDAFFDSDEEEDFLPIKNGDSKYTYVTRFGRLSLQAESKNQISNPFFESVDVDDFSTPSHPNLEMTFGLSKRITIIQSKEQYDDDDDTESPFGLPSCTKDKAKRNDLFDDEDTDMETAFKDDPYDPSTNWLRQIHHSVDKDKGKEIATHDDSDDLSDDQENRPPRNWHSRDDKEQKKLIIFGNIEDRTPLRVLIDAEDPSKSKQESSSSSKKRIVASRGKSHKLIITRALSPPRFPSKLKQQLQ